MEVILAASGEYDAANQSFYVVKYDQWISVEKPGAPPTDPLIGSIARKAMFRQQHPEGFGGAIFWEVGSFSCNPKYKCPSSVDIVVSLWLHLTFADRRWDLMCLSIHGCWYLKFHTNIQPSFHMPSTGLTTSSGWDIITLLEE